MKTLCDSFAEQVEAAPNSVAVHARGIDTTYAQLGAQSEAIAAWLRDSGIARGDRVALLLGNSAEYVASFLGILRAGCVVVTLNPDTTVRELSYVLSDCAPGAVVVGPTASQVFAEVAAGTESVRALLAIGLSLDVPCPNECTAAAFDDVIDETVLHGGAWPGLDDVAQILYTSGTTGRPKGVTLSHRNIAANCRSILDYLELTSADSVLVALPFFYSYGNSLLFTHLSAGGRLVLAADFVFWNRMLALMQEQQVSGFSGVPASFAMLLHKSDFASRSFPQLRYLTCAGGGMAPAVVRQLREILPSVKVFLMYGQTEATARLSTLMPEELDAKPGSIGRGISGVTLAVLNEQGLPAPPGEIGEIVARGENVMLGYWNDPRETERVLRAEGLHTGDLARMDEDGYIYIAGRRSDIIKKGAYRLNPKEIEEVILTLDGIAEAAVVGVADEIWGESPIAFVVPTSNGTAPAADAILRHCRQNLPRYKLIREVRFVDRLPRTASGKIKRSELSGAADATSAD